jgi:AraC-like DNA-binding protein
MADRDAAPLTFHTLHESATLSLCDYRCRARRSGPEAEEWSVSNDIVLMRHGAFCKHFGRRMVTADVNQAVFFSRGSRYRVSHPADCGDRGTVFRLAPEVLNDIVRGLDPSVDERPGEPLPFVTSPCEPHVFKKHRALVQAIEGSAAVDPLWVDVTALDLVARVLESAFARREGPRRRRRTGTDRAHVEGTEAAKSYLAARIGERVTLDQIARAVHLSPFHLARIFAERTGVTVHRYLVRLRLRAALERLADQADDLTALALELGFGSHSHFTDSFRREFGRAPSQVRRDGNRKTIRELSKDLEV